jgi:hypothetical protein
MKGYVAANVGRLKEYLGIMFMSDPGWMWVEKIAILFHLYIKTTGQVCATTCEQSWPAE